MSIASEDILTRLQSDQSKNWLYVYSAKTTLVYTTSNISSDTSYKASIWVRVERLLIWLWLISDKPSMIKLIYLAESNIFKNNFFMPSYSLSSNVKAKVVRLGIFYAGLSW